MRSNTNSKGQWICLLGILFIFLGHFFYGEAKSADSPHGFAVVFGAFLFFLAYLLSQISWGYVIVVLLGRTPVFWEVAFWGSLFYPALIGIFGFFPILGSSSLPGWLGVFLLSFLGCLRVTHKNLVFFPEFEKLNFEKKAVLVLFLVLLFALFLGASTPHPFWDSLWYHLTSSRLWYQAGRIVLPPLFPIAFKTGLWDYHFVIAQILLGGVGDRGLIAAHVFSQWAALSSFVFSFFVLIGNSKRLNLSWYCIFFGLIACESFQVVQFAKNDWGACFWGLCFLAFLLQGERAGLLGIAAGACFSAKYSVAFFLFPLIAKYLWTQRKCVKEISIFSVMFLLALLPVALRNAFLTGNPFFPALDGIFPTSLLGPSWENISDYEGFVTSPHLLFVKLESLVFESPAVVGIFLIWLVKEYWRKARGLVFSISCGALIFIFITGPKAEWRLFGAGLLLLSCIGFEVLREIVFNFAAAQARVLMVAAGISCFIFLPDSWRFAWRFFGSDAAIQIREFVSGSSMAWVRMNSPAEELVATLNEQRIYYLFPHTPIRVFDNPQMDKALARTQNPEQAVQVLRTFGVRYLVLSAESLDRYHNQRICDWMYILTQKYPKAVAFDAGTSKVLDLKKLY